MLLAAREPFMSEAGSHLADFLILYNDFVGVVNISNLWWS